MIERFKMPHVFGAILVILAALLWSFDGVLRQSLYVLPPTIIIFYEALFGAVIISPFFIPHKQGGRVFTIRDWLIMSAIALFSGTLGTLAYTAALVKINFIPFSVVVLLQQTQPLFAVLFAVILLKERLTSYFIKYALLAVIAVYFVSFPNLQVNLESGSGTIIAATLGLVAAFFWGSSTALSKHILKKVSFVYATAMRFFFTVPIALALVFATGSSEMLSQVSVMQVLMLLAITLSTGLVALTLYYKGLQKIPARRSTIYELTWPLSAIVLDFVIRGTVLSPTQIIGAVVLIFSMLKITRYSTRS